MRMVCPAGALRRRREVAARKGRSVEMQRLEIRQFDRVRLDRTWDGIEHDPEGVVILFDPMRPAEVLMLVDGSQELRFAPKAQLTVLAHNYWLECSGAAPSAENGL